VYTYICIYTYVYTCTYIYIYVNSLALIYMSMYTFALKHGSCICACVYPLRRANEQHVTRERSHLRRANEHAHMYTFALVYEPCIYTDLTHSTNTVDLERVLQGMLQCMLQCVCLRLCCSCRRTLHAATISSILAGRKQSSKEAGIATHIFLQKSNFAPTFSSEFSSE